MRAGKVHKVAEIPETVVRSSDTEAMTVDGNALQLIGKVRTFDGDIGAFKSRIKVIQERMAEIIEGLAEERLALKDAEGNLSEFLLGYFHETGEKQIDLGPGQGREVILKGKLGKQKAIQTNIFSHPVINTNEGRKDLE